MDRILDHASLPLISFPMALSTPPDCVPSVLGICVCVCATEADLDRLWNELQHLRHHYEHEGRPHTSIEHMDTHLDNLYQYIYISVQNMCLCPTLSEVSMP